MINQEYVTRVMEIRQKMNSLATDMGATYSSRIDFLDKIINDAVNGDLADIDLDEEVEIPYGKRIPLLKTDCKYFECALPFH